MKKIIIIILLTFSCLSQAKEERITIGYAFSNDEVVIPLAVGASSMGLGFLLGSLTLVLAPLPEVSLATVVVVAGASLTLTASGALITAGGTVLGLAEWATNEFK